MAADNARILVIGAGVNGSVCAARLLERGVDVTVLARGKRLAEIERDGIVIENPFSQKRRVTKVRAIGALVALASSLGLHLHQVGRRTFTSKLLSMPSTQRSRWRGGRYA